ncbi:MAG: T4 RnlA family RNA ligase [Pseudomonadota bacterium]|nr:T4 RnlA family RNA ligase [Pseudomonadota bacterium]
MPVLHAAANINTYELIQKLNSEIELGNVSVKYHAEHPNLALYCYTKQCVYERNWNEINTLARGLIIDVELMQIIAYNYKKFFNVSENNTLIPDLSFEAYEKLDGSLIAVWYYRDAWYCSSKGSFESDQAQWAKQWLQANKIESNLTPGVTYLFEAIYPENKIVIPYDYEGLVLHGIYAQNGEEANYDCLALNAWRLGVKLVEKYTFSSISEMLTKAKTLPFTEEGWVLRFENGYRLKVKGEEYKRIHAAVSNLTPLSVWEAFSLGKAEDMRRDLPEEFWPEFDMIREILAIKTLKLLADIETMSEKYIHFSDKELGLQLKTLPELVQKCIFDVRKNPKFMFPSSKTWSTVLLGLLKIFPAKDAGFLPVSI